VNAREAHRLATARLHDHRPAEAARIYRELLAQNDTDEAEDDEWLAGLVGAYQMLGAKRHAAHVLVYLQAFESARELFAEAGAAVDAARAAELWARRLVAAPDTPSKRSARALAERAPHAGAVALRLEAARGYEGASLRAHAAIAFAEAGAHAEARRVWEAVLADPRLHGAPYERALVHFNLGVAARAAGDAESADRQLVRAQQLLEEVADRFESAGERDRAFYCYGVLLHLGREEGAFENLAEGFLNCIRILKEDNLKYYVLQYYEDFLRLAIERGELHAAASGYREAADFARRAGLPYERSYLQRSAETWWLVAEANARGKGPPELGENALAAAIDGFAALADFARVRESYRRLAELPLPEAKRARYARLAARYPDVAPRSLDVPQLPDYLRRPHAYPRVWEADLIEWELDGDPLATCAAVLGDRRHTARTRRAALEVVLMELDAANGGAPAADETARQAKVAVLLGELWLYPALSPLERLFQSPEAAVRLGVMKALRNLDFKRSFHLLRQGLADAAPEVRDAAMEALEALHFPHLFDPLVRVFREHPDPAVKATALVAIGRIRNLEAMELLVDVLCQEGEALRDVARQQLVQFDAPQLAPLLRKHLEVESGPAKATLAQVLRAIGG